MTKGCIQNILHWQTIVLVLPILLQQECAYGATPSIVVRGRESVVVTTNQVRMADIAEVSSAQAKDDDALVALNKIEIDRSPAPGKTLALSAAQILERLQAAGVDVTGIGYVLPRQTSIRRASRNISEAEVRVAVEEALRKTGREVAIREVRFPAETQVVPGNIRLESSTLARTKPGQADVKIRVKADGVEDQVFDAAVLLDEWDEIPVARHGLNKGMVVGAEDVMMARMNIAKLPRDVAQDQTGIIGLKLGQDIIPGEAFRMDKLELPPLVETGGRVTMVYRSGSLEASATGIALEAGFAGQIVRIRNDNSKKVVSGTVLETGLVEVKP